MVLVGLARRVAPLPSWIPRNSVDSDFCGQYPHGTCRRVQTTRSSWSAVKKPAISARIAKFFYTMYRGTANVILGSTDHRRRNIRLSFRWLTPFHTMGPAGNRHAGFGRGRADPGARHCYRRPLLACSTPSEDQGWRRGYCSRALPGPIWPRRSRLPLVDEMHHWATGPAITIATNHACQPRGGAAADRHFGPA